MVIDSLNRDSLNLLYAGDHHAISQKSDTTQKFKADYHSDILTLQRITSGKVVLYENPIIRDKQYNLEYELHEKSLFTGHKLADYTSGIFPYHRQNSDWVLCVFIFCLIILAHIIYNKARRFKQMVNTFNAYRNINNLVREGNLYKEFSALMLLIVFILTSSLLLYLAGMGYYQLPQPTNEGFFFFLKIAAVFTILYLLRISFIAFVGYLFKNTEISYFYLINILVIDLILGMILLPFLIFIVYLKVPLFLYLGFIIYGGIFVYRFFRGILIGSSGTKFSKLYLFLYLCTLEILPLIVLVKLTIKYFLVIY